LIQYETLKNDIELKNSIKDAETYSALLHIIHLNVRNDVINLIDHIELELAESL